MGAEFLAQTYKYCTKQELEKQVEYDTEQMMYEGGSSYSGNWAAKEPGIVYSSLTLHSVNEAEDLIADNNDKWGCLSAVKVTIKEPSKKEQAELTKAAADYNLYTNRIPELTEQIVNSMKSAKSTRRTCKSCTSAIATQYICSINCPVCGNKLCSPTDTTRLKAAQNNLSKAQTKLTNLRNSSKAEAYWVVGGLCSS